MNEALEELSSSLEELGVSEEELRQQNEELMTSRQIQEAERERYQELFDFTPDGYLITSPEGIIKEANRAAGLQLGVRQDYLQGKPLRVYIKDRKDFDTLLSRFQGKKTKAIEEWDGVLITRGKRAFYARIIIAPIDDHQGRLIGLRWLIRDITERKQAEDDLQKSKEQLRHLADQLLAIQENERRKIALEVHDRLGSSLSAIKFKVEDIFQRIDQEPTYKNIPTSGTPHLPHSRYHRRSQKNSIRSAPTPSGRSGYHSHLFLVLPEISNDLCEISASNRKSPSRKTRYRFP